MNQNPQGVLKRFHDVLVREIRTNRPDYLGGPFSVAEIYQNLVPYRTHRDEIGVEMNADYEHALLQLLAGEGDYLTIESRTARQEIREELESPNPNTGLYRDFAAADVRLNPEKVMEAGEGWSGLAAVLEEDEEEAPDSLGFLPALVDEVEAVVEDAVEATAEARVDEVPLKVEDNMDEEAEELDSHRLPFELSDQEVLPPVDAVSLDGDELVEEEPTPARSESGSPGSCPWCRENLPDRDGIKFCPFCGSNVRLVPCPGCGEELELNWRFCVACGTEVSL